METLEKIYKKGYLEKCELKEDADGFYLDLHYAGINGEDKDLYIPKVRLGFSRNTEPAIIKMPNDSLVRHVDYKLKLGLNDYYLETASCTVISKTGQKYSVENTKYAEVTPEKDVYTFDENARAFDMISAVSLKEFLSNSKKVKEAKESIKTEERKRCLTCKWYSQSLLNRRRPCFACSSSYSKWEEKD